MASIEINPCSLEDIDFILTVRNESYLNFGSGRILTKEEHYSYMNKNMSSYWIAKKDNIPVAYIGVVNKDLTLATAKQFQGLGIAKQMLQFLQEKGIEFNVKVLENNTASRKLFESLGIKYECF